MKRDACVFGVTHPSCCGLAKRDDRGMERTDGKMTSGVGLRFWQDGQRPENRGGEREKGGYEYKYEMK